jgi:spoIIIJ-associated protein
MNEDHEAAIRYAKKFLEDLLSFFGANVDVYATSEGDEVIELEVPSTHLNSFLIGQHGETMHALQFMTSNVLRSQDFAMNRVSVDVADYKKQRAKHLAQKVEEWTHQVKESGQPMELRPMNAADRRIVHKIAGDAGINTESIGEGRDRHVVLKLA